MERSVVPEDFCIRRWESHHLTPKPSKNPVWEGEIIYKMCLKPPGGYQRDGFEGPRFQMVATALLAPLLIVRHFLLPKQKQRGREVVPRWQRAQGPRRASSHLLKGGNTSWGSTTLRRKGLTHTLKGFSCEVLSQRNKGEVEREQLFQRLEPFLIRVSH